MKEPVTAADLSLTQNFTPSFFDPWFIWSIRAFIYPWLTLDTPLTLKGTHGWVG